MDGKTYQVSMRTAVGSPPDYVQYQLEAARRKAGNELYNILYSLRLPAVVDIEEISMPNEDANLYFAMTPPENELRIVLTVNPVTHRHIEFAHAPSLLDLPIWSYTKNPIKRAIQRFANFLVRVAK